MVFSGDGTNENELTDMEIEDSWTETHIGKKHEKNQINVEFDVYSS